MCVCVRAVQRTPHLRFMLTFALPLVARCVARPLIRPEVSPALSKLRVLCICNNKISSLIGIECLTSLEELDVAHNDISSFDELRRLRHLDKLTHLWVDGTLLCFASLWLGFQSIRYYSQYNSLSLLSFLFSFFPFLSFFGGFFLVGGGLVPSFLALLRQPAFVRKAFACKNHLLLQELVQARARRQSVGRDGRTAVNRTLRRLRRRKLATTDVKHGWRRRRRGTVAD